MKAIDINNNPSGLKIFINGIPQIELIPEEKMDLVVNALEKQIDKLSTISRKKDKNKVAVKIFQQILKYYSILI
jgi:hypothetical protein